MSCLMLFLIFLIRFLFAVKSCTKGAGVNVVNIKVSADGAALVALLQSLTTQFSISFNTKTALESAFGGIFDMINEDLEPYGVQVYGNFSSVLLDVYLPKYDHMKCTESDPVIQRTSLAASAVSKVDGSELGNRIFLFFCPEFVNKPPTSTILTRGTCSNVAGFMFGEFRALRDLIFNETIKMIARSTYKQSGAIAPAFNSDLCSYMSECSDNMKFGEFRKNVKRINHLGSEKYIIRREKKVRDYRKTEKWSKLSHKGHDIIAYPTTDYSNEDQLFSDFENNLA